MINNVQLDLKKLELSVQSYFYKGFDLSFLHGNFCAFLSIPIDEDDSIEDFIPLELFLDPDKVEDEAKFEIFIDKLTIFYQNIADTVFKDYKLFVPLINCKLEGRDLNTLNPNEEDQLFLWLFGYLNTFLQADDELFSWEQDSEFSEQLYFEPLFEICATFLLLAKDKKLDKILDPQALELFEETKEAIVVMWEFENNTTLDDNIKNFTKEDLLERFLENVSKIFFAIRMMEDNENNEKEE